MIGAREYAQFDLYGIGEPVQWASLSVGPYYRMQKDIFPSLNQPQLYVIHNYGGMDPKQIEGLITNVYELFFQYINNVEHVESRSIQSMVMMKLYFHPGTDMAQAMAETITQVNRRGPSCRTEQCRRSSCASTPAACRSATSSSPATTRSARSAKSRIKVLFRVRPMFAALPGVSAPPPFGASHARAITINVDPNGLRSHGVSAGEVVKCLDANNTISPAGNVRIGDQMPLVPFNGLVTDPQELGKTSSSPAFTSKTFSQRRGSRTIPTSPPVTPS